MALAPARVQYKASSLSVTGVWVSFPGSFLSLYMSSRERKGGLAGFFFYVAFRDVVMYRTHSEAMPGSVKSHSNGRFWAHIL